MGVLHQPKSTTDLLWPSMCTATKSRVSVCVCVCIHFHLVGLCAASLLCSRGKTFELNVKLCNVKSDELKITKCSVFNFIYVL